MSWTVDASAHDSPRARDLPADGPIGHGVRDAPARQSATSRAISDDRVQTISTGPARGSLRRTTLNPGGALPVTMSTNLGWPSEPDPEPEHRRLGWLARMLSVSRETDEVPVEDVEDVVAAGAAAGAAVSDDRDGEVAHAGDAAATGDAQGDVIALETPAGSAMPDDDAWPSTAV